MPEPLLVQKPKCLKSSDDGQQFARATCGTLRLKLLKIGALVRTSVRRVKVAMPSGHPYQSAFAIAHARLSAAAA